MANKLTKQKRKLARKNKTYFFGRPCYTFYEGKEKHNPENKRRSAYKASRGASFVTKY